MKRACCTASPARFSGSMPRTTPASLALAATLLAIVLASGAWHDVSLMKEYTTRAESFWREGHAGSSNEAEIWP